MRKIRDSSEDEMIAIYLQTELYSIRFHQKLEMYMQREKIDLSIIQGPNWQNASENVLRRKLLGMYRGYGRNERYFTDFPANARWEWAILTRDELEQVRYINWEYWLDLTDGTRMAVDGARNALAGKMVHDVSSDGFMSMANALQQGTRFPSLILVTKDVEAYLVIMEGHARLTAYLIAPEYIPAELEVIIGYSEQITTWGCY